MEGTNYDPKERIPSKIVQVPSYILFHTLPVSKENRPNASSRSLCNNPTFIPNLASGWLKCAWLVSGDNQVISKVCLDDLFHSGTALERNHRDQVTVWRLGLENWVFYSPCILSPKIEDNLEISMVLRFKITVNVVVRIRIRVRASVRIRAKIRILILILTLTLIVDVLPLVTF